MARSRGLAAGALDRRIIVERSVVSSDEFGGQSRAWAVLGEVWAQVMATVRPISDDERLRAGEVGAEMTPRFRIRWGLDVGVTDRVRYEGRIYEIIGVREIGRREGQEITGAARAE